MPDNALEKQKERARARVLSVKIEIENRSVNEIKNSISSERFIKCGVPQGSILGPLFFPWLFADDTNLTASENSVVDLKAAVNPDLDNLRKCLIANRSYLSQLLTLCLFGSIRNLKEFAHFHCVYIAAICAKLTTKRFPLF